MTTEEVKQEIAQSTGIPVTLLTGETAEENIAQAKALLAYKREHEAQRTKTTSEQFSDWLDKRGADLGSLEAGRGIQNQDTAGQALAEIEKQARLDAGGYPTVQEGSADNADIDGGSTKDHFADWIGRQLSYNPFNNADSWG